MKMDPGFCKQNLAFLKKMYFFTTCKMKDKTNKKYSRQLANTWFIHVRNSMMDVEG